LSKLLKILKFIANICSVVIFFIKNKFELHVLQLNSVTIKQKYILNEFKNYVNISKILIVKFLISSLVSIIILYKTKIKNYLYNSFNFLCNAFIFLAIEIFITIIITAIITCYLSETSFLVILVG
jgi:uncharacterized membrane protein